MKKLLFVILTLTPIMFACSNNEPDITTDDDLGTFTKYDEVIFDEVYLSGDSITSSEWQHCTNFLYVFNSKEALEASPLNVNTIITDKIPNNTRLATAYGDIDWSRQSLILIFRSYCMVWYQAKGSTVEVYRKDDKLRININNNIYKSLFCNQIFTNHAWAIIADRPNVSANDIKVKLVTHGFDELEQKDDKFEDEILEFKIKKTYK